MSDKQYRPRLTPEQYRVVLAMKNGWKPDLESIPQITPDGEKRSPAKILVFDVETAPINGYMWGLWKQTVTTDHIISDWFMLTWSAKWLFEDEVFSDKLTTKEVLAQDDKRITESIWRLIDEADIIIAHNANRFDVKKLNTRFFLNGLNPPMPYQVIDTLEHVRKRFSITSNRLDYIGKILKVGGKMDTGGFKLWSDCLKGDKAALLKMEEYNKVDVKILEEIYLKIRNWIKPHPNLGLFIEEDVEVCPACGGEHLTFGGTPYRTAANSYETFRCDDCGSVGRNKSSSHKKSKTRSVNR